MEQTNLKNAIESLLFVSGKPLSVKDFSKFLEQQAFAVQAALDQLVEERKDSGIIILESNGEYQLATPSLNSTVVKNFLNAELREKLTDATVEVLAIIAYRQPISKGEIEAIRGVNSQYSLRQLLIRGLTEKIPNPNDARGVLYQTTTEFLQHLGLRSVQDLPAFENLVSQIKLPETAHLTEHTGMVAEKNIAASPDAQESAKFSGEKTHQQTAPPIETQTTKTEKENQETEEQDDDDE